MSNDGALVPADPADATEGADPQVALAVYLSNPGYEKYGRFIFAALSAIPWVGSMIGAAAALHAEQEQGRVNLLMYRWLEEHQHAYRRLEATVAEMVNRMEEIGETVAERVKDDAFLGLVRRGFRVWDGADSEEKRGYVRRILTNAAGTRLCSDDVVRLFLQWLEQYNELHFRVIRIVYKSHDATRADIWGELHGEAVPENSPEADLFKLMIHDLSLGHVIRHQRDTTADGRFLAATRSPRRGPRSPVLRSAFDDDKPYELTELGKQFVHYSMNEIVPRMTGETRHEKP